MDEVRCRAAISDGDWREPVTGIERNASRLDDLCCRRHLSGGGAPPSARRGVHGLAHPIGDLYERLRG